MRRLLLVFITLIVALTMFCSCSADVYIDYYSKKENYIQVSGTVSYIAYNEDRTALYIDFSEMYPTLDDSCFKITGKNLQVVCTMGIEEKIVPGKQVVFVTAPKYFGDGYVMPIVSISINGETLLDFEEGYNNLLLFLRKTGDGLCEP